MAGVGCIGLFRKWSSWRRGCWRRRCWILRATLKEGLMKSEKSCATLDFWAELPYELGCSLYRKDHMLWSSFSTLMITPWSNCHWLACHWQFTNSFTFTSFTSFIFVTFEFWFRKERPGLHLDESERKWENHKNSFAWYCWKKRFPHHSMNLKLCWSSGVWRTWTLHLTKVAWLVKELRCWDTCHKGNAPHIIVWCFAEALACRECELHSKFTPYQSWLTGDKKWTKEKGHSDTSERQW